MCSRGGRAPRGARDPLPWRQAQQLQPLSTSRCSLFSRTLAWRRVRPATRFRSAGTQRRTALKQHDVSCWQDVTASAAISKSFPSGVPAGLPPQKMSAALFSYHKE